MHKDDRQETEEFYQVALRWMGVGIEFCLVVGAFAWGGHWLDILTDSGGPWMLILGFFVGFGFMFYWLVKKSLQEAEWEASRRRKKET